MSPGNIVGIGPIYHLGSAVHIVNLLVLINTGVLAEYPACQSYAGKTEQATQWHFDFIREIFKSLPEDRTVNYLNSKGYRKMQSDGGRNSFDLIC